MMNHTSHSVPPAKKLGAKFQTQPYRPHSPTWLTNYTFLFSFCPHFAFLLTLLVHLVVVSPSQSLFWNEGENKQTHQGGRVLSFLTIKLLNLAPFSRRRSLQILTPPLQPVTGMPLTVAPLCQNTYRNVNAHIFCRRALEISWV